MGLTRRFANLLRSPSLDREIDDELQFHIDELTDELVAGGLPRAEAARQARRRFGDYVRLREESRDMDILRSIESFLGDLRFGARQLRLNPGFAAVAIASLALGIGANSAVFQLINALRIKGLEVHEPSRLVAFDAEGRFYSSGWYSGRNRALTFAQYEAFRQQQRAFTDILAFGTTNFNLSPGGEVRNVQGLYISPNFLNVLGVAPQHGQWLAPDAEPRDCTGSGALLNHTFWQREFAGDPSAIGREIVLDGRSYPILAVTPPSFTGVEPARRFDVALPLCADEGRGGRLDNRSAWWLTLMARTKPGWSIERASAHVTEISRPVFESTQPESYRPDALERYVENKLRAVPAHSGVSDIRREYENPLWILLASTGLVLLIACANLANLLLARATARGREVALRQAVGASRKRLIAQLLAESMLLAGCGAIIGSALAYLLSRALVSFVAAGGADLDVRLGLDWRVVGFTAALGLLTCLLFGLAPALRASSGAPADAMRGGRGTVAGAERQGLRRTLVVSQIALSLVLLVGAILFGRSLRNLLITDTGMQVEGVLVAEVGAGSSGIAPERRLDAFREIEQRLQDAPDTAAVASVAMAPFSGSGWNEGVHADDDPARSGGETAWFNRVSPGYFAALNTQVFAGRDINAHDDLSAPSVAVINHHMAQMLFGDEDPIGRSFRSEANLGEEDPVYQVVGLVQNTKYNGLREEQRPIAFLSMGQEEIRPDEISFVIRPRGGVDAATALVKHELARVDPGLNVRFEELEIQVAQSVARERLMANLSGAFGVLAAVLSTLGLYGVMSYMVARRKSEIGVRMALGAEAHDIRGLVFSEAGRLLAAGLGVGLAISFALSRYAESLLFELAPNDPATLAVGCALLAATAALAALVPIRRAVRLDPIVVLRDD